MLLKADILINKVSRDGVNALGYIVINLDETVINNDLEKLLYLLYAAGETLKNVPEHENKQLSQI